MAVEREIRSADILLVEDNQGDIRLIQEALQEGQPDHSVHVVKNGVEALDFLFRRDGYADAPRPDIVILDLNLPRMNGGEVLAEVRADADLRRVPVVVFTSSRSDEDVNRLYDLGANAYLTKPANPDEFIETIQTIEHYWLSVVRLPD